jgi:RNA polymerase sigma-70 factor (ECF subfamily)
MIAEAMTIEIEAQGALIALAMAGDEVAFARIVATYHGDMARIAYLVCGSLDVAEEAEQAAWAKAWHRLGDVRDPARLRPWLMSVAANEARQIVRGQKRRSVRELDVAGPTSTASVDRAALLDLANALAGLDPRDRAIIGLRYIAGLDSAEIGRAIGMSASGVRVRLHRLLGRLREELGDD